MDIIATDIGGLLFAGLLIGTITAVPLFILYGIRVALRKSRLPDAPGVFTPEQVERLVQLKYRYETTEELYR